MENQYVVTANKEGFITNAFVKEGDSVSISTPLFNLANSIQNAQLDNAQIDYIDALSRLQPNSPKIRQLEIRISQAEEQLTIDEKNYNRYSNLVKNDAVSQVDYDRVRLQYENAKSNLNLVQQQLIDLKTNLQVTAKNKRNQLRIQEENSDDYIIESKINGIVLSIYKEKGELVRKGEAIAKMGGGTKIIKLFVAEEDISYIKLNQPLNITLNSNRNEFFEAQISRIYPEFDTKEQSFIVEAEFQTSPQIIFPGTQVQANIIIAQKKDAIVIPTISIIDGNKVMNAAGDEISLKIGIQNSEWTEIISGLSENEKLRIPEENIRADD
jgi:multidrug resistance efflux pump